MASIIFKDIIGNDLDKITHNLDAKTLHFKEGDTIAAEDISDRLFVIDEGNARLLAIDEDGARSIIQYFNSGSLVYPHIFYSSRYTTCFMEFTLNATITSLDFKAIKNTDAYTDAIKIKLMENMLELSANAALDNSRHTAILVNRSIRKKLSEYFEVQKVLTRSVKFKIPVSMAELADYLCIDRAAMLREIKKMQDDGLLVSKNRHITLLV